MMTDKYSMSQKFNIFYAKRNIVDSIYSEAKLEGISVTFPDTMTIVNGYGVAGMPLDDLDKIKNLRDSWKFIFETINYPIDLRYIKQINREVGKGIIPNEGAVRTTEVRIGGTKWTPDIPNENQISKYIHDLMSSDQSVTEKAITLMLYLMRAQTFIDGNKRTAQIAANQVMIQNGKGIITIPEKEQPKFFEMLIQYYETNNMNSIKKFVYDVCVQGIKEPPVEEETIDKSIFYKKQYRPKKEKDTDDFER